MVFHPPADASALAHSTDLDTAGSPVCSRDGSHLHAPHFPCMADGLRDGLQHRRFGRVYHKRPPTQYRPGPDIYHPDETGYAYLKWACGAAGSALPWHGRGHRFDPDQVHQFKFNHLASRPFRDFVASLSQIPKSHHGPVSVPSRLRLPFLQCGWRYRDVVSRHGRRFCIFDFVAICVS